MTATKLGQYANNATFIKEMIASLASVGIVGLFYVRIYPDGTIINLGSDANWADFYFNQVCGGVYQKKDIVDQFFTYSGVSLWELNSGSKVWQDAKQYFGYGNGVLICEDHQDFREAFCVYSTPAHLEINYFYINQIDAVKKIKQSFLSQAADLIQPAEQTRLALQYPIFPNQIYNPAGEIKIIETSLEYQNTIDFFASTDKNRINPATRRICVTHKNTGCPIFISPRRGQCFLHLMQGKSAKEIAQAVHLTPKTVEHYLEMLRKELGCRSGRELIISYAHQIR